MEDKILIIAEKYSINSTLIKIFPIIVIVLSVIIGVILGQDAYYSYWIEVPDSSYKGYHYELVTEKVGFDTENFLIILAIGIGIWFVGLLIYLCLKKVNLTITDKKAYGCTAFGKRVDLPLDSVTAIALGMFKSIAITSASGAISFSFIKNRDEVYSVVSKLLNERQHSNTAIVHQEIPQSNADELKKFKDLLDSGVITQEEFDAKKKQLLGL